MPPSPGLEEGDSITNYNLCDLLGRGAFAETYRAINRRTGDEVAIKKIDKKKLQDDVMIKRVHSEVEIHSQLKHQSVVEMFSCFEDTGFVYLVLELCEKGELQRYLKSNGNRMSEEQARKVMSQIVSGLLYLHSHGIVHRDLSPTNVLLKNNMDIKIADFGLATKISTPLDKHHTMCGTPNYISPEIATKGEHGHGHQTDLWSLGCLLYTCLVGEPPFDSEGVKATLTKVAIAEYQLPAYLSKNAKDLIRRLLQKNPTERIDLHNILDHPFMCDAVTESIGVQASTSMTGSNITSRYGINTHPLSPPVKLKPNTYPTPSSGITDMRFPLKSYATNTFDGNISSCSSTTSCSSCTQSPYSFSSYSSASCGRNTTSDEDSQRIAPCSILECMNKRSPISDKCSRHLHTSDMNSIHSKKSVRSNSAMVSNKSILSQKKNVSVNGSSQLMDLQQLTISEQQSRSILTERNVYSSTISKTTESGKENANPSSRATISTKQDDRNLDKLMEPLCASRLRPFRQKTSNTVTSILDDESISLEFIRTREGVEHVMEVMRVSRDGIKVTVFTPHEKTLLRDAPLPVPPSAVSYAFAALPQKYWKKYQYAAKFVRLVKTKTPKVTLYSSRAKCSLMESDRDDFEALFYDGSKVSMESRNSNRECSIIDAKGNVMKLDADIKETDLSSSQQELLTHARTCHQQCQLLENSVTSLQNNISSLQTSDVCYFPLVVGRRPQNSKRTNKRTREVPIISKASHQNDSPVHTTPRSVSLMSYAADDSSVITLTNDQQEQQKAHHQTPTSRIQSALPTRPNCGPARGPARASSTSSLDRVGLDGDSNPEFDVVTRSAFIAEVGWAQQLKSGEIQIQFNEGTQLKLLNPHSKWLRIEFVDELGQMSRYNDLTDEFPTQVREKLHLLPKVINLLSQKQMMTKK